MKILFVGDLNVHTRTFQRKRAFEQLGCDINSISSQSLGYIPGISDKLSVLTRIATKIGFPPDECHANSLIIDRCTEKSFDVIWVEKGNTIYPKTLGKILALQSKAKLVSYSEDDMFQPHNHSRYYLRGLPYYHLVITTKSYNLNPDELPALGARSVIFVDKAFDKNTHRPVDLSDEEKVKFGSEVGFIGTFETDRANLLLSLAERGLKIRIFGNGWSPWLKKHPNLIVENIPLYEDDYVKAICATKINLCFLRKINRDLQTDRSMEIPACGAFMLAERTEEHLRLFEEGREAAYFDADDPIELFEKVTYYLNHDEERCTIAAAGRQKCLDAGYSFHDRLMTILEMIQA